MKKKINIPHHKTDPELIQRNSMRLHYPHFKYHYNTDGNLCFTGTVTPAETMPTYKISVEYREDSMPRVKVIEPSLVAKPPHYYHEQGCLCLYKPDNFNWSASKPISNYIISWSTCWLYFYEVWKQTNIWYGPEAEHSTNKE